MSKMISLFLIKLKLALVLRFGDLHTYLKSKIIIISIYYETKKYNKLRAIYCLKGMTAWVLHC